MNRETITARIKKVLSSNRFMALKEMVDSITDETSLVEDLALDSIQILEMVIEMENEFNFRCEPDELNLDMFVRFSRLVDFVEKKINKGKTLPCN